MQALAADENARLVTVLARVIAERLEATALRLGQPAAEIPVDALKLDQLLSTNQTNPDSTLVLLGSAGKVIFSQGDLTSAVRQWPGGSGVDELWQRQLRGRRIGQRLVAGAVRQHDAQKQKGGQSENHPF